MFFFSYLFVSPLAYLVAFAAILFGFIVHNAVQAMVAASQGDQTPKLRGYLSTDPLVHLSQINLLFLAILGFTVPNPIPLNSRSVRGRGAGEAWVWMSGVLGLIAWAIVLGILAGLSNKYLPDSLEAVSFGLAIAMQRVLLIAVFNVFPVPPLDGARALVAVGNVEARRFVGQLEQFMNSIPFFGFMLVFVVLDQLGFLRAVSTPIRSLISAILDLLGLPNVIAN